MTYLPMAGGPIAAVTCRACGRRVRMNPGVLPTGCQARLRCMGCGQRGADIQYLWQGAGAPDNVVAFRRKISNL
jgi:hypothetical protein